MRRWRRDYQVELAAGDARRNIVTRNVPLNHLVGKEFAIGEVRIRGIRLCEPCDHLQRMTGKPVIKGLLHRGGLRAQILTPGTIRVGDAVSFMLRDGLAVFLRLRADRFRCPAPEGVSDFEEFRYR